nr:skin secretory protein xP2-like [Penaeus vannamei]
MSFLNSLQQVVAGVTSSVTSLSLSPKRFPFGRENSSGSGGGGDVSTPPPGPPPPLPDAAGGSPNPRLGPKLVPTPGLQGCGATAPGEGQELHEQHDAAAAHAAAAAARPEGEGTAPPPRAAVRGPLHVLAGVRPQPELVSSRESSAAGALGLPGAQGQGERVPGPGSGLEQADLTSVAHGKAASVLSTQIYRVEQWLSQEVDGKRTRTRWERCRAHRKLKALGRQSVYTEGGADN